MKVNMSMTPLWQPSARHIVAATHAHTHTHKGNQHTHTIMHMQLKERASDRAVRSQSPCQDIGNIVILAPIPTLSPLSIGFLSLSLSLSHFPSPSLFFSASRSHFLARATAQSTEPARPGRSSGHGTALQLNACQMQFN